MADVVHRTTKELRLSVNTPDFPTGTWIHNPDLSTFGGNYQAKYANIAGDLVTLMSAGEQAAVDAAEAAAVLTANRTRASGKPDLSSGGAEGGEGIGSRELFELFNRRDNYMVNRVAELQAALDAMKASSGPADNIRNAIPASWLATNTRTRAETIAEYKSDIAAGVPD